MVGFGSFTGGILPTSSATVVSTQHPNSAYGEKERKGKGLPLYGICDIIKRLINRSIRTKTLEQILQNYVYFTILS